MTSQHFVGTDEGDADTLLLDTVITGNLESIKDLVAKMQSVTQAGEGDVSLIERMTRTFLTAINEAPKSALQVLLDTGLVDLHSYDDINERNCLHQAAIYGRQHVLEWGLAANVAVDRTDVYGRVPLHYASLHGRLDMLEVLLNGKLKIRGRAPVLAACCANALFFSLMKKPTRAPSILLTTTISPR